MSINTSGERANNGRSRNYQLYWCYQCHQTVRIASGNPSEVVCPRCFGQFLYEIDMERPRPVLDFTAFDPSPEARLLEALSLMFNPPVGLQNHRERENRSHEGEFPLPRQRNRGRMFHRDRESGLRGWLWPRRRAAGMWLEEESDDWRPESGILARPRTWIILRPSEPIPTRRNQDEEGLNVPQGADPRNYFIGSGLQELIEQLTQNDRPGPPPLPDSAIDSIPTVKLTASHLANDSECPVCKEKFDVGDEARELPCNHFYHSQCIVPWLRLHNSCPVCRHELPAPSDSIGVADTDESHRDSSAEGGGSRTRRCPRLRQQLASIWPFRSSQGVADSRWCSCYIL